MTVSVFVSAGVTPSVCLSETPITFVIFIFCAGKNERKELRPASAPFYWIFRSTSKLLLPSSLPAAGEAGTRLGELSPTDGFDSVLGFLHVWCRPSSSLLCLLNSKTQRPQTDMGSLCGSPLPPKRNPFHKE